MELKKDWIDKIVGRLPYELFVTKEEYPMFCCSWKIKLQKFYIHKVY